MDIKPKSSADGPSTGSKDDDMVEQVLSHLNSLYIILLIIDLFKFHVQVAVETAKSTIVCLEGNWDDARVLATVAEGSIHFSVGTKKLEASWSHKCTARDIVFPPVVLEIIEDYTSDVDSTTGLMACGGLSGIYRSDISEVTGILRQADLSQRLPYTDPSMHLDIRQQPRGTDMICVRVGQCFTINCQSVLHSSIQFEVPPTFFKFAW